MLSQFKIQKYNFELILYKSRFIQTRLEQLIRFKQQIKMSYAPLSSQQPKHSQEVKHRNPIFTQLKYPKSKAVHTLQSQITSSLLLQQLLYFNWFYSFIFAFLYLASIVQRFMFFDTQYGVPVRVIIYVIFIFLDFSRMQNAFHGNLKESFPQICAFLILSIFTIGGQLILLSRLVPTSPLEWTILFYGVIFHLLQFLVCIFSMGKLTQSQKALFLWRNPISQSKK